MTSRLQAIIDAHRATATVDQRDAQMLLQDAQNTPTPRSFSEALRSPGISLITEIKRRSPSAGDINVELDPAAVARQYAAGGAACLSVLTDVDFFGGSVADLQAARSAVSIPVLRKDFTVDRRDVIDARLMGADAILLIVAALSDEELQVFNEVANTLSLTALFEAHDVQEVQRAVDAGAQVIGVNQRDLRTFDIDTNLAERLASSIPDGVIKVAESGIKHPADVERLAGAGYDAALIGTSLVSANDISGCVAEMQAAGNIG